METKRSKIYNVVGLRGNEKWASQKRSFHCNASMQQSFEFSLFFFSIAIALLFLHAIIICIFFSFSVLVGVLWLEPFPSTSLFRNTWRTLIQLNEITYTHTQAHRTQPLCLNKSKVRESSRFVAISLVINFLCAL